jgi:hypothetical protein
MTTASEASTITSRGTSVCRGCQTKDLKSVLDLGLQPLANELLRDQEHVAERFPLHLRVCNLCGLGQVGEYVLPDRLFSDYPYLSSTSTSWLEHSKAFAHAQVKAGALSTDSLVVEIASNDGYMLRQFASFGIRVLGVEPAANVAELAEDWGIPTRVDFFGESVARAMRNEVGPPELIIANNVLAHVPDLHDFLRGLAVLASPNTRISIENPSFATMLNEGQFDTIYHEHYSYLSAHAVRIATQLCGLELIDVEELPTHGGSNRYWLALRGATRSSPRVAHLISRELDSGLLSPAIHKAFRDGAHLAISGLAEWLDDRKSSGRIVAAYGAAAKGNTLINATGASSMQIVGVFDASPEKIGKFLPGSGIRVLPPAAIGTVQPDDVLILPWNLAEEISELVGRNAPSADRWIAIPHMKAI